MTATKAAPSAADQVAAVEKSLRTAVDSSLAQLRRLDPDAAADMDALRRRELVRPSIVVVGETKRGKSSLLNALVGVPDLSPVDAAVATSSYLEFVPGAEPRARAFIPGREDPVPISPAHLRDWGTALGRLPDGMRPPRRIEIAHPAPMLKYVTLIDTPGVGGLDSLHAEVALDAVERATALLFVVDASSPFSKPEVDFLIEAAKRVNMVVFALTKLDAYPGWKTVLDDDRALLQAHAPRFGSAPFFPVSARLAELALRMPASAQGELVKESRIADLQHALIGLASKGHALKHANTLRAVRSEFVRMSIDAEDRMSGADPDPALLQRIKDDRARVAARKRTESRQWSLALNTETQRARVEATGRLRTYISQIQEQYLNVIDAGGGDAIKRLPYDVDRALFALSVRLSGELEHRFRVIGQRILSQIFHPRELQMILRRLNARLRTALNTKPRREGGGQDSALIITSTAGTAFMAGRGAMAGASAIGIGGVAGAGILLPVVGVGLGLAAGAFLLWKRKSSTDKQQARVWLREVLGEARAALSDEVAHRFTDLQYALTLALDDAIERRIHQLDAQIARIDQAMVDDKATRQKKRSALVAERDGLRARIKSVDEILARARTLLPKPVIEDA